MLLAPYRVLDLTDDRGEIAGMMLGDLGADVIRVEPPGGSDARRRGPWLADGPDGERSLQFQAFNRNKRSIALDLSAAAGREEFLALVAGADFVLESAPPGVLAPVGLDFAALCAVNPKLVHVQITPYGSDGPYAEHAASDLTIAALGGPLSVQGEAARPPLRVGVPQTWRHAGAEAAVAALMAHARMRQTGEAQRVDVSGQAAMTWTMLNAMVASAIQGYDFERRGSDLQLGVVTIPLVFECRDGHVVAIGQGSSVGPLLPWLREDGVVAPDWGAGIDWTTIDARSIRGEQVEVTPAEIEAVLRRFTALHTKRELFERGLEMGVTLAPVNTLPDLLALEQLAQRDYFAPVALPDGSRARAPGAFAKLSATPLELRRPAPRLDEHGDELRAELRDGGRVRVHDPEPPLGGDLPLAGLKVADFTWIGVGPISARYLADHGATVVKVEGPARADGLRATGPFMHEKSGWNRSQFFGDFNTSKRSLSLDLKTDGGRAIARRLIQWADVYMESYTPGSVARLGLGYDVARELNPSIVMLSTCLMGQTGPAASMAGYGYHAGAVAGFYELTGWPDLPPTGPWMAYTDTIAPRFVTSTLLAAIDHQRRTGQGQHIDAAQMEMALHFLAPELLDHQLNGTQYSRRGNRADDAAPHGTYPCAGDDQWCAIAVHDDAHWDGLRQALGDPAWMRAPELQSLAGRLERTEQLDAQLARWTSQRDPREVMQTLLAHGVPAGVVQRSSDLLRDPQYAHRGFHRVLEHAEMGAIPYSGHQFRMRGYASGPRWPAPLLGEHSYEVLRDILGYGDEEIAELVASEVVLT